jgi:hypothetical protein
MTGALLAEIRRLAAEGYGWEDIELKLKLDATWTRIAKDIVLKPSQKLPWARSARRAA